MKLTSSFFSSIFCLISAFGFGRSFGATEGRFLSEGKKGNSMGVAPFKNSDGNSIHHSRVLQGGEPLAFVTDESLRTPSIVEEAFHTYVNCKHHGFAIDAFAEANLNNDDQLDESEMDRLIFVVLYFFYGGTVETYSDAVALFDNFDLVFINDPTADRRTLTQRELAGRVISICQVFIRETRNSYYRYEKYQTFYEEDPHLVTLKGIQYNYNGICDLVLMSNPSFSNSTGLEIHGRTDSFTRPTGQVGTAFSAVAVRIGTDVLEVHKDGGYYLNGIANATFPAEIGGGRFTILKIRSKICYGPGLDDRCAMATKFDITSKVVTDDYFDVFTADHIYLNAHRGYVDVLPYMETSLLSGSTGMSGTYPGNDAFETDMMARDGTTELTNETEFGEEWQVNPSAGDSVLFVEPREPQFPSQCIYLDSETPGEDTRLLRRV